MVSLTCTALLDIQKMAFEKERRDLFETAEFEGKVVAKLAKYAAILSRGIGCNDCPCHKICTRYENKNISCEDVFLKTAYLAVEEEIDADGK